MLLAILLASVSSFAQSPSATSSTETAIEPSLIEKASKHFGISYYGQATGPALSAVNSDVSAIHAADRLGEAQQMNLYNDFRFDYKTGGRYNIRVNARFEIDPIYDASATSSSGVPISENANLVNFYNMRVGVVGKLLLPTSGGFNIGSAFALELPTSIGSINAGLIAAPRLTLVPHYDVPDSRFGFGAYIIGQSYYYNSYTAGVNDSLTDFMVYVGPYANYKLSAKTAATLQINADTLHKRNKPMDYASYTPEATNVQLGMNWDVSNNFSINPYVQMFTDYPALNTSLIGAYLSATML